MPIEKGKIKVIGKRILVEKEKIDLGALRGTPAMEEDGYKNAGKIVAVGNIGLLARLAGVRVGQTVYFRKFFIANEGSEKPLVFVDVENITGIQK